MRKFTIFMAVLFVAISAMAIPAHRESSTVTQPDGSKLTIKLIGDEFYHFNTTLDGYTIVKDDAGVFEYAIREGDKLKASGVKAHEVAERTAAELTFLKSVSPYMTDREAHAAGEARRVKRDAPALKSPAIDVKKFRGLIILINLVDVKFSMNNPSAFYNDMVNTKGFTGYTDDSGKWVPCTGSMYDYYSENSNGIFQPQFDVVGPVEVNYHSYDFQGTYNSNSIFIAALDKALAKGVDFTRYDADGNGYIDMIFFQVAGLSSSFSGNDSRLLWPHKSSLWSQKTYNGKRLGTYACSTELYGWSDSPSTIVVEGIGTMCHEFTHVMGFPDLYDTNYEQSGGESHHPGEWDIMAGGGSFNSGRTPCGFTIFERYFMGFANPKVISTPGHYTLNPIMSNEGYIIKSPVNREYFILENRQKTRWDYYVPGHGMIIARVDSTSTTPWYNNTVNCNPAHNYYELVRAGNSKSGGQSSDPFPGTKGVNRFSASTTPAFQTWNGTKMPLGLFNITEVGGVISFDMQNESVITKEVEDFETMPATTSKTATGVVGRFTTWDFNQSYVDIPTDPSTCNGKQAVMMISPSVFTSAKPVYYDAYEISFDAYNTASTIAKLALQYSTDGGVTWVKPKSANGVTPVNVSANSKATVSWPVELSKTQGVIFRVQMSSGSKTLPCYIDDFTIYYNGEPGKPYAKGDVNGDGAVNISDANILINIILGNDSASKYDGRADVDGNGSVNVSDVNAVINILLDK